MPDIRFGLFDFNTETGELLREGRAVHLQAQPAKVLATLIAARGALVTRDALRDALWPDGVSVDFDRGLNFAVAQVRTALGDSADSPLFIRTIPKRGYQFIAPLPEEPVSVTVPDPRPGLLTGKLWIAAAIAMICAAAVWMSSHPARQEVRIAMARFQNETGNPALDPVADSITDSLVATLTSQTAGVIGNAPILRRSRGFQDLDEIGSSLQVRYVIIGQIQRDGPERVRMLAHLIELPAKTHLRVSRQTLDSSAAGSQLAHRIAADFASYLGLPPPASN